MLKEALIFSGAFIGCILSMFLDYKKNVKDIKAWIFSIFLSFAVFGVYETLVTFGYLPAALSDLALFGIALFIGFSINELTKKFWEIVKRNS